MTYWVGVVGSKEGVDRLRTQDETWWCISKKASPGDLVAMYVARNRLPELTDDEVGFVSIFEVIGPAPERATECRKYGGSAFGSTAPVPVTIAMRERFPRSLRLAEMKLDKVLSTATFVRRSFQGTFFPASPPQFARIKKLLIARRETTNV